MVVVGNGLTLDLRATHKEALVAWNTSQPLSWPVKSPGTEVPLLEHLPHLDAAIKSLRGKNLSDFAIVDEIARQAMGHSKGSLELDCELRHFLALAYSYFQLEVEKLNLKRWRWTRFLAHNRSRLLAAISFNYDLVLESALETARLPYRGIIGAEIQGPGALVVKPHGSIDFDYHPRAMALPASYPLKVFTALNDMPIRRINRSELLSPRLGAELVAPLQASKIREFQWVAPGFEGLREVGKILGSCIFIGISYWEVDRPEIDFILDTLGSGVEVVIANPNPPEELTSAISERGLRYTLWPDGPPPDLFQPPPKVAKTPRNAPCPCGSGLKYKKCCGK